MERFSFCDFAEIIFVVQEVQFYRNIVHGDDWIQEWAPNFLQALGGVVEYLFRRPSLCRVNHYHILQCLSELRGETRVDGSVVTLCDIIK
jgi:hypothetical protein